MEGKQQLLEGLQMLSGAADYLSQTYDEFPNLNDDVDIQKIIPMSLDEWHLEIDAKIESIKNDPSVEIPGKSKVIKEALSETFEKLLKQAGDTPEVRLMIANFTLGYVGATYGLHVD